MLINYSHCVLCHQCVINQCDQRKYSMNWEWECSCAAAKGGEFASISMHSGGKSLFLRTPGCLVFAFYICKFRFLQINYIFPQIGWSEGLYDQVSGNDCPPTEETPTPTEMSELQDHLGDVFYGARSTHPYLGHIFRDVYNTPYLFILQYATIG